MFPVYFVTLTTYGTWLPGDERGWVDGSTSSGENRLRPGDAVREKRARLRMRGQAVYLSPEQRRLVEETIRRVAGYCRWHILAMSVRSNHVHVVVQSNDVTPEGVMSKFKAWCSRRLNEQCRELSVEVPVRWWTRHGSTRYLNDEKSVEAAVQYVVEGQDRKTSRGGMRSQH